MENTTTQGLVTLFVKVKAKPGSESKAKSALLADVQGAWTESDNLKMELYRTAAESQTFYLFERWQDQAALENHFAQPYTQAAFDLQQNDLSEAIEMNYLTELFPLENPLEKEQHRALTTLIVPFETKPGNGDALVALFREFVPLVRKEKGNFEFHFYQVNGYEDRFVLYERWETQGDLDDHNQLPTTAALVDNVGKLLNGTVIGSVLFTKDISN